MPYTNIIIIHRDCLNFKMTYSHKYLPYSKYYNNNKKKKKTLNKKVRYADIKKKEFSSCLQFQTCVVEFRPKTHIGALLCSILTCLAYIHRITEGK